MATLTLKKKPVVQPEATYTKVSEAQNLIGKFAVVRYTKNKQNLKFTAIHDSMDAATAEAKRIKEVVREQGKVVLPMFVLSIVAEA